MMVLVNPSIDPLLMQKHVSKCVEKIIHNKEDGKRANDVHL